MKYNIVALLLSWSITHCETWRHMICAFMNLLIFSYLYFTSHAFPRLSYGVSVCQKRYQPACPSVCDYISLIIIL